MTATGKTYGDALYDMGIEESVSDEMGEQLKMIG